VITEPKPDRHPDRYWWRSRSIRSAPPIPATPSPGRRDPPAASRLGVVWILVSDW